ncbi:MAG: cbb3-type cytochrome c oxidase subunit I, partial [Gammaproteobacteria bacterium]
MAALTMYPDNERLDGGNRVAFNLYIIASVALFVLMMLLGLIMRMSQATWLSVTPGLFYRILSMHGAGMVGTTALATTAVMWFFLRKYVRLHLWAFVTNFVMFMLGALCIIVAIFADGYGALWTFLYPLPMHGMGLWSPNAAALFMVGYLLIGVGMLVYYLDAAAAIIKVHGNLGRALGLQWLFGGTIDPDHPKAVVASTMVVISNTLGILAGAVVLVMSLVNIYYPQMALNALVAKNLIYWFGHMYINATIYMGVIAVYELLARYSG